MTGTHADDTASAGATREFEFDVMDLLVEALRHAVKYEAPVVGTDTLLAALVMGDTDAGAAIAPGMRKAGALSGVISGRAGRGWASDDEGDGGPVAVGADEAEVTAAWREARWRIGLGARESAAESGRVLPAMSGALRACLLLALTSARAEGAISVRCRHVARALLDLPGSRAREALLLRRLDTGAAATALDGVDAKESAGTEGPESRGVTLLRRAGTLGRKGSGNKLSRAIASWTSGASRDGSPMLFAVTGEAVRQAVRCGRGAVESVDLLLGVLALDRALPVAGRSLPASLAAANSAPDLLRRHGVRQTSLVHAATAAEPVPESAWEDGGVWLSADAQRVLAGARLSAAEHGSPTVGTVHLLAALLDEPATEAGAEGDGATVVRLLVADRVDVAALRAELLPRLGA